MNYLYCLFPAFVQNNIFYRVHAGKQHGIIPDSIDKDINSIVTDTIKIDFLEVISMISLIVIRGLKVNEIAFDKRNKKFVKVVMIKNNEIFFKRENDKTYKTQYSNFKKNFLKAKQTDLATQLFEEKLNEFNEIQQLPKISLEDAIKSHEKEIAQFKTSDEPKSVAKEEIYGIPVVRGINQTTIWKILNKIYDNKNIYP